MAAHAAAAPPALQLDEASGADLALVERYLAQLLPALPQALGHGGAQQPPGGGGASSLEQLGLGRGALAAAGLPPHAVNALYRGLAAHAAAFETMVAGEVAQLRGVLERQSGAGALAGAVQLLDGPVVARGGGPLAPPGAALLAHAAGKSAAAPPAGRPGQQLQQQQASGQHQTSAAADAGAHAPGDDDVDTAGSDTRAPAGAGLTAAANGAGAGAAAAAAAAGAPSASELVADYAQAYASMKESLEVRLRHEARRVQHLSGKVQQLEGSLSGAAAQLESADRRAGEQRAELDALAGQHAELQQALAASHAAHLALQQHHMGQMEAWKAERDATEQQHKAALGALQQELAAASAAATALGEAGRQAEALRLLYNEELARASRLAVELSKATAAADRAAAQEAAWAAQVAASDGRADNAEGLAAATQLGARQLEAELAKQQQQLTAQQAETEQLRLLVERSRLAAVAEAAAARARVGGLSRDLAAARAELAGTSASLATTTDALRRQGMELDGANAQLRAGRSHLRQLMADLEAEQEKSTGLAASLDESKAHAAKAASEAEVARSRLATAQEQLVRAEDAAADAQEALRQAQAEIQERAAAQEQLQLSMEQAAAVGAALEAEAGVLRERLSELAGMQQEFGALRSAHEAAAARVACLEAEGRELSAKAEALAAATSELAELRGQHADLQESSAALQQQLEAAQQELADTRAAGSTSASQLHDLQEQLSAIEAVRQQLAEALEASTAQGEGARQQAGALAQRLEGVQAALDAAEADRQALAAQRDGWMASYQEAFGKLREWTASSGAAARQMAARADALTDAMQQLTSEAAAGAAAGDSRAAAGGGAAGAAAASAAPAAAGEVLDQLAALRQLVRGEARKQLDGFDESLQALSQRVQARHVAAQSSWQKALAGSGPRRASAAALHGRQSSSLASVVAAASAAAGAAHDAAALSKAAAVPEGSEPSPPAAQQPSPAAFQQQQQPAPQQQQQQQRQQQQQHQRQQQCRVPPLALPLQQEDSCGGVLAAERPSSSPLRPDSGCNGASSSRSSSSACGSCSSRPDSRGAASARAERAQLPSALDGPGSPHPGSAAAALTRCVSTGSARVQEQQAAATLDAPAGGADSGDTLAGSAAAAPQHDSSAAAAGGTCSAQSPTDATGVRGGGALSGWVSLATYQEQMQAVAKLHADLGQTVVQLREAAADAEGAQQQLQAERREAACRTTAMRDALGQLHGQLQELRKDHTQLQESHRRLMTKELQASGLLRDRYVADLFGRLQDALWKLDTARRRAATWGFQLLVPLGRCDRGIQTQPGAVWAAATRSTPGVPPTRGGSAPGASQSGAGACAAGQQPDIAQLALSALAQPQLDAVLPPAGRAPPAFTQRAGSAGRRQPGSPAATSLTLPPICGSPTGYEASADAQLLADARRLLRPDGGDAAGIPLLSRDELLRLLAALLSAKAQADARALRSGRGAPPSMWQFLTRRLLARAGEPAPAQRAGAHGHSHGGLASGLASAAALAQLLGSAQQHAAGCPEVATFLATMTAGMPAAAASPRPRSGGSGSGTPRRAADSPSGGGWGLAPLDASKLLPAVTPGLLLPPGAADVAARVVGWPGMAALLAWVVSGGFVGGLGPQLGRPLMDVQAPHLHLLLLEAGDVLRLGQAALPRLHVVDAAVPFARLLRIPGAAPTPRGPARGSSGGAPPAASALSIPLLVLSSAALQQLAPLELQASMAAALAPLALQDALGGDAAALATLASLLALAPALLLAHLPPEMHAMGGCLAAALTAVDRLVAAAGDRAALLVCQDLPAALRALCATSPGGAAGGGVAEWEERVAAAEADGRLPSMHELLPAHGRLAAAVARSACDSDDGQLPDEGVLLLRAAQLLAFAASDEHRAAMAGAPRLHPL